MGEVVDSGVCGVFEGEGQVKVAMVAVWGGTWLRLMWEGDEVVSWIILRTVG